MNKIEQVLFSRCDATNIARLGLSATNFQMRAKNSIGKFFDSQQATTTTSAGAGTGTDTGNDERTTTQCNIQRKNICETHFGKNDKVGNKRKHTSEENDTKSFFTKNSHKRVHATHEHEYTLSTQSKDEEHDAVEIEHSVKRPVINTDYDHREEDVHVESDEDLAYAQKLQARYDKEDRMLSAIERTKSTRTCTSTRTHNSKSSRHCKDTRRIDNFFKPKKK